MAPRIEGTGYSVWAADNVVYGPVELPALIDWIKEERVTASSWVFSEREDDWRKASQFDELKMFFRSAGDTAFTGGAIEPSETGAPTATPKIKPGALRRVKIFSAFTDAQLARFVEFMEVQPVRQWCAVVKQGEPGAAMYLILEGEVRVRLMIGDKETILVTLPAGEFFGEISLFDHGPRSADVVANVDSVLLKISASAFQKVANEAPELAAPFLLAIGRTLTGRIRADNKRLRDSVSFARASGI